MWLEFDEGDAPCFENRPVLLFRAMSLQNPCKTMTSALLMLSGDSTWKHRLPLFKFMPPGFILKYLPQVVPLCNAFLDISTFKMSTSNEGRFVVSASNHGAYIFITGAIGISWSILVTIIRVGIKLYRKNPLTLEESISCVGCVGPSRNHPTFLP